jgi:carbamoyltransferase
VISLGLNGFSGADHDAGAAIVRDGRVVAAVEEERLNRRRHAPGAQPALAVREVLAIAGIEPGDIDVVCHGWRPEALGLGLTEPAEAERIRAFLAGIGAPLRPGTPVVFMDRTAVDGLIVDGAGESTAGALFRLRGGAVEKVWNLGVAGSLGLLYEAATAAIGMRRGDEGKTMGLASYGRWQTMDKVAVPADDRFPGPIPRLGRREEIVQHHRALLRQMRSMVPANASFNRRADLALGVQSAVESQILSYLAELTDPGTALVLAGGVALNCTINATVAQWCAERGVALTIPPPANDGGIAIGAAVGVSPEPGTCAATDAFLGREYGPADIADRLTALGARVTELSPAELVAGLLERDELCGWFEGRAEIGPRALGKRAILARTDSARLRDRLNVVKGRESWRPLAPSVLPDEFRVSFRGAPSPYMLITCAAAPTAMRPLAGVVHVDNTARPQVVDADMADGPYAALLAEMRRTTGHAVVTCTSFNPAGQPIVYTPEDAFHAAVAMGLDLLAGDGWGVRLRDR